MLSIHKNSILWGISRYLTEKAKSTALKQHIWECITLHFGKYDGKLNNDEIIFVLMVYGVLETEICCLYANYSVWRNTLLKKCYFGMENFGIKSIPNLLKWYELINNTASQLDTKSKKWYIKNIYKILHQIYGHSIQAYNINIGKVNDIALVNTFKKQKNGKELLNKLNIDLKSYQNKNVYDFYECVGMVISPLYIGLKGTKRIDDKNFLFANGKQPAWCGPKKGVIKWKYWKETYTKIVKSLGKDEKNFKNGYYKVNQHNQVIKASGPILLHDILRKKCMENIYNIKKCTENIYIFDGNIQFMLLKYFILFGNDIGDWKQTINVITLNKYPYIMELRSQILNKLKKFGIVSDNLFGSNIVTAFGITKEGQFELTISDDVDDFVVWVYNIYINKVDDAASFDGNKVKHNSLVYYSARRKININVYCKVFLVVLGSAEDGMRFNKLFGMKYIPLCGQKRNGNTIGMLKQPLKRRKRRNVIVSDDSDDSDLNDETKQDLCNKLGNDFVLCHTELQPIWQGKHYNVKHCQYLSGYLGQAHTENQLSWHCHHCYKEFSDKNDKVKISDPNYYV